MAQQITIADNKKIYFLSDFHLGAPDAQVSRAREKKIVRFLNEAAKDASHLFILGDLFDFWYEYKHVVPKGFTRILGKLAELTDNGIVIYFFVGNHDMWMRGYFEQELGIPVYHEPQEFLLAGKKFLIGHGDGLGPGDHGYKFIKKVFRNRICQWLFGALHPYVGIWLANYSSKKSRQATGTSDRQFLGEEKEWLIIHCKQVLQQQHYDFFVFGHRHLPIRHALNAASVYVNLGDWINYFTYAVFDGQQFELKTYEEK
jgi:UDP-2,3-diacylglucosamine hydrolase